ncbi:hypothetical protein ACLX1H_007474 [Fusarium chlamydosporum]
MPFTNAALLPRLNVPFKLPGAVFSEPEVRSLNVVPFKALPGQSSHGHRLHHTLSLVKRLVENQGDMVEVSEEDLQKLLDQISRLHDQVNGMMPSGESDRQPSRETDASSGGQPGQLPAGSSDGSSSDGQPKKQSPEAEAPDPVDVPGPSEVPVVSDLSLRPELPEPTDEAATVPESPSPSASDQPDATGQSPAKGLGGQADSALAAPAGIPTRKANDESANSPSDVETEGTPDDDAEALKESANDSGNGDPLPSDGILNKAVTQPTGEARAPTETQLNKAEDAKSPEKPKDEKSSFASDGLDPGETSAVPGGAFVEDPDDAFQTLSSDAASGEPTGDPARKENQESSPLDDECDEDEEVSGQSNPHRNPNCTPGNRSTESEPARDASTVPSLVATEEKGLAQVASTASELATLEATTEDPLPATGAEGPSPALETEATSTPTIKAADAKQLTAPTLIAGPSASSRPEASNRAQLSVPQTSLGLRTLVFTSVLTRSSTIKMTTTITETVDANEPTRSFKAPGHVFKEDEDAGAAFNRDGKLAVDDSDDKDTPGTSPRESNERSTAKYNTETPLQRTPVRTQGTSDPVSLRATPLRTTPLRATPLRATPLRTMPFP